MPTAPGPDEPEVGPPRQRSRRRTAGSLVRVTSARALLLENIHSDAAWNLKDAGWDVERLDRALSQDELVERILRPG